MLAATQHSITIVGLGPGAFGQLSIAAWEVMQNTTQLYLRTEIHPTVAEMKRRGVSYTSFDHLYEQAETFDDVYAQITAQILSVAQNGSVTYAVPGHPLVGETSVQLILKQAHKAGITVTITPSMSALDAIFAAIRLDPSIGLQVLDSIGFTLDGYHVERGALFLQVYDRFVASQLKLTLLEVLDGDLQVMLIRAAGVPGEESILHIPLHELDMHKVDHLTSVYVPASPGLSTGARDISGIKHPLDPLVDVMSKLRGQDGCPWDRKQTHASLKRYLIEESYEVIDAVDAENWGSLCEELGDVLLQVVFHAQLGAEAGTFSIDDVVDSITAKMMRRHPHVFGDVEANDVAAVLRNWEVIKRAEKAEQGIVPESLLSGVPRHLPALMQAEETQKKAAKVGFEWADVNGAVTKVVEEAHELQDALSSSEAKDRFSELGDLLFAIVNVARYLHIDPEEALRATTSKFKRRFSHIEKQAAASGRSLADMTLEEMDRFWDEAKLLEQ